MKPIPRMIPVLLAAATLAHSQDEASPVSNELETAPATLKKRVQVKRSSFILISGIWILASGLSHAILDTNHNGLSDFWERVFNNGSLFDES